MNMEILRQTTEKLLSLCCEAAADGYTVVVTGHDMPDCDSIISAVMLKELLLRLGVKSDVKFATRPDGVTERLVAELGLIDSVSFEDFAERDKLVLVDHHVTFYKNGVVACIDHHTTPPEPHFAMNLVLKASSCGRIIFDMATACGVNDDWIEKMAIYSVYLDTQSCLAPKFAKDDIPWLEEGIARLGIDREKITEMGFCLNSLEEDAEVLAMYAYKRYEFNGKTSASNCIQIDDGDKGWKERIDEILDILKMKVKEEDIYMWALVVNMPKRMRSELYFVSGSGIDNVKLDRLASRSKDVIPVVSTPKK